MKTEQYSLRDNTINFEVEIASASNLALLSREHLVALANYGLSSWAWRAGAKKTSDGKIFSVAEVAKDLATIKSKDGEPLPDDIKLAMELWAKWSKAAEAGEYNIPDELTGADANAWVKDVMRLRVTELAEDWIERQLEKHSFDFNGEVSETTLPAFMRLRRLAIARNLAKAAKAGLADLE